MKKEQNVKKKKLRGAKAPSGLAVASSLLICPLLMVSFLICFSKKLNFDDCYILIFFTYMPVLNKIAAYNKN